MKLEVQGLKNSGFHVGIRGVSPLDFFSVITLPESQMKCLYRLGQW